MVSALLRIVSLALCAIALGWFVGFAVEQSKSASAHQQAELNSSAPASMRAQLERESSKPTSSKPGAVRKAIDSAFSTISSPFSGLTSSLSSQWTLHIVDTLLALLIYGFGLSFVARVLRLGS